MYRSSLLGWLPEPFALRVRACVCACVHVQAHFSHYGSWETHWADPVSGESHPQERCCALPSLVADVSLSWAYSVKTASFPVAEIAHSDRSNSKVYSGSQIKGAVCPSREVKAAEASSCRSHGIHSQETVGTAHVPIYVCVHVCVYLCMHVCTCTCVKTKSQPQVLSLRRWPSCFLRQVFHWGLGFPK